MGISLSLQIRRLVWVLQDLARSLGGGVKAIGYACRQDHSVGIGLLEGGAWAHRGQENKYRIRIVNDSPDERDVELRLRGERASGDFLEARHEQRVLANTTAEVFLLTNWEQRFEITSEAPPTDPFAFLGGRSTAGSCRVTATLSAGGKQLDEIVISQRIAE